MAGRPGEIPAAFVAGGGIHDIQFLMRLSHRLGETNSASPDLTPLVQQGRLVMVPMGGGLSGWVERLDAFGCRQFHLFDRECEPETSQRRTLAEYVNSRPDCQAVVTTKRSLENCLHADAIAAVGGGALDFDDGDCVASVLARAWHERVPRETPWLTLSRRARRRMLNRAKHSLNVLAVEHMTPELLTERDPSGELVGWLNRITAMTAE